MYPHIFVHLLFLIYAEKVRFAKSRYTAYSLQNVVRLFHG
jgi:hypothetical protein